MVGRTYLERGAPVVVLARWRHVPLMERTAVCPGCGWIDPPLECGCWPIPDTEILAGGPRNVLIRRADGTLVTRPFRGLRKAA